MLGSHRCVLRAGDLLAGPGRDSAGRPFYVAYTTVGRLWGLSPLDDLRLGGALMWVMGQMMYAVPVLILINVILWRDGGRGLPGRPSGQPPPLISPTR